MITSVEIKLSSGRGFKEQKIPSNVGVRCFYLPVELEGVQHR